jgi:hypothetical protein
VGLPGKLTRLGAFREQIKENVYITLIAFKWHGSSTTKMSADKDAPHIELGMKVSVRRSNQNRIGVVVRLQGDYVIVRWTNSDLGETAEYQAHRDEVTPLAGWL